MTEHIRTSQYDLPDGETLIKAELAIVVQYQHPSDAPVYTVMTAPARGRLTWSGATTLQGFGDTETEALNNLLASLRAVGAPISEAEWRQAAAVAAALPAATDWLERPFPRDPKPQKKRTRWRGPGGKRIHIYNDEHGPRQHADPNCPCAICRLLRGQPPPTETI